MLNPPIDFSCQKVLCITIRVVDPNFITTTRLFALSEMTAELVGMDSATSNIHNIDDPQIRLFIDRTNQKRYLKY